MHMGHARTHLVIWLLTRRIDGKILMRFDDLDRQRFLQESEDDFLQIHEWLGLDFDEGPVRQSEREERYYEVLMGLRERGEIYACDCSRSKIEQVAHLEAGDGGLCYPGTCRSRGLSFDGSQRAWRFRVDETYPGFRDTVFGEQPSGMVRGDIVLKRADGVIAYHVASVVDDEDFAITQVIRGEDLLVATSRQVRLIESCGFAQPTYTHVPIMLGPDGKKLSKSHGSVGVRERKERGDSPEQILGEIAYSMGLLSYVRPVDLAELVERFDPACLKRAQTIFEGPLE